jgi:hypothetical protein
MLSEQALFHLFVQYSDKVILKFVVLDNIERKEIIFIHYFTLVQTNLIGILTMIHENRINICLHMPLIYFQTLCQ